MGSATNLCLVVFSSSTFPRKYKTFAYNRYPPTHTTDGAKQVETLVSTACLQPNVQSGFEPKRAYEHDRRQGRFRIPCAPGTRACRSDNSLLEQPSRLHRPFPPLLRTGSLSQVCIAKGGCLAWGVMHLSQIPHNRQQRLWMGTLVSRITFPTTSKSTKCRTAKGGREHSSTCTAVCRVQALTHHSCRLTGLHRILAVPFITWENN